MIGLFVPSVAVARKDRRDEVPLEDYIWYCLSAVALGDILDKRLVDTLDDVAMTRLLLALLIVSGCATIKVINKTEDCLSAVSATYFLRSIGEIHLDCDDD